MRVAAIVPAAGRGERLGPGAPKALRLLGGVPLLVHAVRALARARSVDVVVVAAPAGDEAEVRGLLDVYEAPAEVRVTTGGATRQESVRLALEALAPDVDVVLVHDAARPLAPSQLADDVAQAVARGAEAVIPALPVADTVKRVEDGRVVETLRRDGLYAVQTPQGFTRELLTKAHEAALIDGFAGTDDASLVERLGRTVAVIPGHPEASKVTRPGDLAAAEAVLAQRLARREH
ncbi:MAG TPA: 2-C-methyl-D-erythritol 4-phosphate cytidylyltransferase [Mycobacteriales bacterium]|nr:2-C-methyl-D-erythritol 4-phosphate cytidylyltransferase [Mycobacteriales bacterium]